MDQRAPALGLVEELRHAEVVVGAERDDCTEAERAERNQAMRCPPFGQERFLDHDQTGKRSRQRTKRGLLIEEGIELDELCDEHPQGSQNRQEQDVLQVRPRATVNQNEDACQQTKDYHFDGDGLVDGNAVGAGQVGRPRHRAFRIHSDFGNAVERIAARGGQT